MDESGVDGKIEITLALINMDVPIPVAVESWGLFCGRLFTVTADSNPAEGMDVCLMRLLCIVR